MHLGDRGGGDRWAEDGEQLRDRLAEGGRDRALRLDLRERRHAVLQRFKIARERGADHVRPRGEKLSELHIGGAEAGEGGRPAGGRAVARAGIGSGLGSTRPSPPSRGNTKPARARRVSWEITEVFLRREWKKAARRSGSAPSPA